MFHSCEQTIWRRIIKAMFSLPWVAWNSSATVILGKVSPPLQNFASLPNLDLGHNECFSLRSIPLFLISPKHDEYHNKWIEGWKMVNNDKRKKDCVIVVERCYHCWGMSPWHLFIPNLVEGDCTHLILQVNKFWVKIIYFKRKFHELTSLWI